MKPQWENQIGILENALQQLRDLGSRLPATFTIQGVTITANNLITSLIEIIGITKTIADSEDIDPILLAIHQPNLVANCNGIPQTMSNLSSSPQGTYLEQLANYTWSIRSSLMWLVKPSMPEHYFSSIKTADLIGKIEYTEALQKSFSQMFELGQNL